MHVQFQFCINTSHVSQSGRASWRKQVFLQDVRIAVISSLPVSQAAAQATLERTHDVSDEVPTTSRYSHLDVPFHACLLNAGHLN